MKLTDALTFAPPCIKYDRRFRHIGSVRDLKQTALRFENCLGEPQALRTALQGTHQFYEYHDGEDFLVVSITSDPPFGFMIDDIRQKGNKPPERGQRERLTKVLADFGFSWRRSVFETIQDWDYPRAYAALFAEDP